MARSLAQRLNSGERLVISGPVGTQLPDYGVKTPAPLYSANGLLTPKGRAAVSQIHSAYRAAGADIVPMATFGLRSTPVLEAAGISSARAQELVTHAARLARRAAGNSGYVVGTGGSIEDCYTPEGVLTGKQLAKAQREHADRLRNARITSVWYETLPRGEEARHALAGAQAAGLTVAGLSFYVRSRPDGGVELPTGETLAEALAEIQGFDFQALGVNCVTDDAALAAIDELQAYGHSLVAYPNGLETHPDDSHDTDALHAQADYDQIVVTAQRLLDSGVSIIGGCCVTGPQHVREFRALVDGVS